MTEPTPATSPAPHPDGETTPAGAANAMRIEYVPADLLVTNHRSGRGPSPKRDAASRASLERFGNNAPITVNGKNEVLTGNAHLTALRELGYTEIPVVRITHLSELEQLAYALADNRVPELASWNLESVSGSFVTLGDHGFDVGSIGFDAPFVERAHRSAAERDPASNEDTDDAVPARPEAPITEPGDLWHVGRHSVLCDDALRPESGERIMGEGRARAAVLDWPYGISVEDGLSRRGRVKHPDFAMASGEMDEAALAGFFRTALLAVLALCCPGAVLFAFIDWRSQRLALNAGAAAGLELLNICVWDKGHGGMGSFYRSQHEFVLVWRAPGAPHLNTFGLKGRDGARSNIWKVPGANGFGSGRAEALARHPTEKPVTLVREALLDVTRRGDEVLDAFGGSGTTMVAAERCGRKARLIEIDPGYVDAMLERVQAQFGITAVLAATGESFAEVARRRRAERFSRGSAGTPHSAPETDTKVAGDHVALGAGGLTPAMVAMGWVLPGR